MCATVAGLVALNGAVTPAYAVASGNDPNAIVKYQETDAAEPVPSTREEALAAYAKAKQDVADTQAAKASAEKTLITAEKAASTATTAHEGAKAAAEAAEKAAERAFEAATEDAKTAVTDAEHAIAAAKAAIEAARVDKQAAENAVATAKAEAEATKAAYDRALEGSEDVKAIADELDAAKSALDAAKVSVTTADGKAAEATDALATAEDAAKDASAAKADAEDALSKANDAIATADDAVKAAEDVLASANATAADKAAELAALADAKDAAEAAHATAKAASDKAAEDLAAAKAEAEAASSKVLSLYDFFVDMGADAAIDEFSRTYKGELVTEVNEATHSGKAGDATDYRNVLASLQTIRDLNAIRASLGLNELLVSDTLMAQETVSCNWSSNHLDHSVDAGNENLAWGWNKPLDGWYDYEKAIYDEAVATNTYKGKALPEGWVDKGPAYVCYALPELWHAVGHYLNVINPTFNFVGSASNNAEGTWGKLVMGQSYSQDVIGWTGTVDEFEARFTAWVDDHAADDPTVESAAAIEAAEATLADANAKTAEAKAAFDAATAALDAKTAEADTAKAAAEDAKAELDAATDDLNKAIETANAAADDADAAKTAAAAADEAVAAAKASVAAAEKAAEAAKAAEKAAAARVAAAETAAKDAGDKMAAVNAAKSAHDAACAAVESAKAAESAADAAIEAAEASATESEATLAAANDKLDRAGKLSVADAMSMPIEDAEFAYLNDHVKAVKAARINVETYQARVLDAQSAVENACIKRDDANAAWAAAVAKLAAFENDYADLLAPVQSAPDSNASVEGGSSPNNPSPPSYGIGTPTPMTEQTNSSKPTPMNAGLGAAAFDYGPRGSVPSARAIGEESASNLAEENDTAVDTTVSSNQDLRKGADDARTSKKSTSAPSPSTDNADAKSGAANDKGISPGFAGASIAATIGLAVIGAILRLRFFL